MSSGLLLFFSSAYFAQGWWYSLVEQLFGGLREADRSSQWGSFSWEQIIQDKGYQAVVWLTNTG